MRAFSISAWVLVPSILLALPSVAQAQSWKPLCVGGGATGGVHNNTWQKVNTTGSDGGTWKKAGDCAAPPPPPPPPPPSDPFAGASLQAVFGAGGQAYVTTYITLYADGTWNVGNSGGKLTTGINGSAASGRWYAQGQNGTDFEINYKVVQLYYDDPSYYQISSQEGVWSPINVAWRVSLEDRYTGCEQGTNVELNVTIRSKLDPSKTLSGHIWFSSTGYYDHCYG